MIVLASHHDLGGSSSHPFCVGLCATGNAYSLEVGQDCPLTLSEPGVFFVKTILNYDLGFLSTSDFCILFETAFISPSFQGNFDIVYIIVYFINVTVLF